MWDFGGVKARLNRLQGEVILPAARSIYLFIACVSLAVAVLAILAALIFEAAANSGAPQTPVPPEYTAQMQPLDMNLVQARLAPPRNVRFVTTQGVISSPLTDQAVLGYFTAETPNGLASYPNDIVILGGSSAAQFSPAVTYYLGAARTALKPSQELLNSINSQLASLTQVKTQRFSILVAARDSYGNVSRAAPVSFEIAYGPPQPQPVAQEPVEQTTDLQKLAGDIARTIDPSRSPPSYFLGLYKRALAEPSACFASPDDAGFVSEYGRAFQKFRRSLNAGNVNAFYAGICDAWRQALQNMQTAQANANASRAQIIEGNMASQARTAVANAASKVARDAALFVAVCAAAAFIIISLFLAFLAMENHSKAMRESVELLARLREREGAAP